MPSSRKQIPPKHQHASQDRNRPAESSRAAAAAHAQRRGSHSTTEPEDPRRSNSAFQSYNPNSSAGPSDHYDRLVTQTESLSVSPQYVDQHTMPLGSGPSNAPGQNTNQTAFASAYGQEPRMYSSYPPSIPRNNGPAPEIREYEQAPGSKDIEATDPTTRITTSWSFGPQGKVVRGPGSRKSDDGDNDDKDYRRKPQRFRDYCQSSTPAKDYVFGRVIEVLLVPPTSNFSSLGTDTRAVDDSSLQRRRFVVIIGANSTPGGSFAALPIKTYNGRGVSAAGVIKAHHCIIWTARQNAPNAPQPLNAELPQLMPSGQLEAGMQTQPIRVQPYEMSWVLDPMSRLDFFDTHGFEGNVDNVRVVGRVHADSMGALRYQWEAVRGLVARNAALGENIHPIPPRTASTEPPMQTNVLERWYEYLIEVSTRLGVPSPPALTRAELVRRYAANPDARQQLVDYMRTQWDAAYQRMVQAAGPSGSNAPSGSGSRR